MKAHSAHAIAIVLLSVAAAGCAQNGTLLTGDLDTASIDQQAAAQPTAKANPLCLTLASQIEALNKDGIPEKVAKAAAKKYRLKNSDLTKADELNKANAEFQTKCSDYPPPPTVAVATPMPPPVEKPKKPAAKVASKSKPPAPAAKPVASAVPPETTGAVAQSATTQP
jgi:hypothetical protein